MEIKIPINFDTENSYTDEIFLKLTKVEHNGINVSLSIVEYGSEGRCIEVDYDTLLRALNAL